MYLNGELTNYSIAEIHKDKRIEHITAMNSEKKGATLSNALQGESFKRKTENDNLAKDLMEQIKQKRAHDTLEK